ncbi:MAG: hypothetical protein IKN72_07205 [Clostridia bacterium]|nr:hypothetical protein [Clostridia bacterium]
MIDTIVNVPVRLVLDGETGSVTPHAGDAYRLHLLPRKSVHLVLDKT